MIICTSMWGGSTELTLIREGERVKSKSFQLGTVRYLAGRIPDGEWAAVEEFVTNLQSEERPVRHRHRRKCKQVAAPCPHPAR